MNILVTGAFGGIGTAVLREGQKRGHAMSAFDLDNERNRKKAEELAGVTAHTFWGDLRNQDDVSAALKNQDAVIHMAAILPPMSERNGKLSDAVNIGGTENIIRAIEALNPQPGLVFTSSMSVMGADKDRKPPVKVTDPLVVSSNYTRQKIESEELLQKSDIPWVVTRLAAILNTDNSVGGGASQQEMLAETFSMRLDNRIEGAWNIDIATALVSAAEKLAALDPEVNHHAFFLAGGKAKGWQMTVREFLTGTFGAMGIGLPDEKAFSDNAYYSDWLDTEKSQELFQYQNHSFDEFIAAMKKQAGIKRYFIRLFSPLIRASMVRMGRGAKAA